MADWHKEGSVRYPNGDYGVLIGEGVNSYGDGPERYVATVMKAAPDDLELILSAPNLQSDLAAARARIDGLLVDRGQMMAELEGCADTIKALTEKNISLSARLASLTSVSEEDVGRVAGELVRQSSGNRALGRFRDLLFSHRHEIVRAALTAFVRK